MKVLLHRVDDVLASVAAGKVERHSFESVVQELCGHSATSGKINHFKECMARNHAQECVQEN